MKKEWNDKIGEAILKKLNEKPNITELIPEDTYLFPKFSFLPTTKYYDVSYPPNESSITTVMLIGNSGKIYYFALKALLSNEEIEEILKEQKD